VRKLYVASHCIPRSHHESYENSVLVLKPEVLKESCRTAENQLFYAQHGFGCNPMARGRAVMGQFLIDGEEVRFNRDDFIGIIDDKHLPEWAQERLQRLQTPQEQSGGMVMGG